MAGYSFVDEAPKSGYSFVDEPIQEKKSMSFLDSVTLHDKLRDENRSNAALGTLKGLADIPQGLLQGVLHGSNYVYDKLTDSNGKKGAAGKYLQDKMQSLDDYIKKQESDYQYLTPSSPLAGVGRATPMIAATLASGGGNTPAVVPPLLSRMGAGAVIGAAQGAAAPVTGGDNYADSKKMQIGLGGAIGGAFPLVGALNDLRKAAANKLMQSAIKPTIAQLKSGDADTAVSTMLDYGINPTKGGVEKIRNLIGDLNDQISNKIDGSNLRINKNSVLNSLGDVRSKFSNQVSPTADISAIDKVATDFMSHPDLPRLTMPIQQAQELKQGTYRVLKDKFGQLGTADTEAQKGLARGLKEQIANAMPEISALNAQESNLIKTLNVAERRSLMELNKNPMGLAALAQSPSSWAMFMADKSALFKSIAARMINPSNNTNGLLSNVPLMPMSRSATLTGINNSQQQ